MRRSFTPCSTGECCCVTPSLFRPTPIWRSNCPGCSFASLHPAHPVHPIAIPTTYHLLLSSLSHDPRSVSTHLLSSLSPSPFSNTFFCFILVCLVTRNLIQLQYPRGRHPLSRRQYPEMSLHLYSSRLVLTMNELMVRRCPPALVPKPLPAPPLLVLSQVAILTTTVSRVIIVHL